MEDDGPYWNPELPESIVLPTIEPSGTPLWDGESSRRKGPDIDEKILIELGINPELPELE
jgi:hypothetical protein